MYELVLCLGHGVASHASDGQNGVFIVKIAHINTKTKASTKIVTLLYHPEKQDIRFVRILYLARALMSAPIHFLSKH